MDDVRLTRRYHVHVTGEGRTSYSADEHPNYRDAFLGSEELAANYRQLHAVRAADHDPDEDEEEGILSKLGRSLRNLEADIFTRG